MLVTEKLLLGGLLTDPHLKHLQRSGPSLWVLKMQKITTLVLGTKNGHYVVLCSYAFLEGEEKSYCLAILTSQPHRTGPLLATEWHGYLSKKTPRLARHSIWAERTRRCGSMHVSFDQGPVASPTPRHRVTSWTRPWEGGWKTQEGPKLTFLPARENESSVYNWVKW